MVARVRVQDDEERHEKHHSMPRNHASASQFSRRSFLTAAGASALALPFVRAGSALGQTAAQADPNHPNPWLMRGCNRDTIQDYVDAGIPVTGVRIYGDQKTNSISTSWPSPPATTPIIPYFDDVSICATIYPNHDDLLNGGYDDQLESYLKGSQPRDMLSLWHLWHECSNFPSCDDYPDLCHTRGKVDGKGLQLTGPRCRAMQTYLYNFAKTGDGNQQPTPDQIATPAYKAAIGAVDIGSWDVAVPWMAPGLDFYSIDLYFGNFHNPCDVLNEWDLHVRVGTGGSAPHGAPGATISVCECNLNIDGDDLQQLDPLRAAYFYTAAKWVWRQPNTGTRSFLCFRGGSGNLGGPFVTGNNGTATRAELAAIGSQDWTNPHGYPEPVFNS
jgi:hypothetical protein